MKKRELSPLADPVFKCVFGEEKEILMELINIVFVLEHPVVNIEYLPIELLPKNIADKTTIVDVRCTDDLSRHFIVEMQILKQDFFHERSFYNAARVYSRQINKGDDYDLLKPVYALCLVDHNLESDTARWRHTYKILNEDEPHKGIAAIEMHYIDLSKCRKRDNFKIEDALDRWVKYFIDPEYIKTLSMNTQYNYPNLKKAVELLDESNYTEGQLVAYDRYLDSIRSWNSSMKYSFEEGVDKGAKETEIQILSIIQDLKSGMSVSDIANKHQVEISYVQKFK
jgi:predicted transposase/invertase (TIGR01784 family)